MPHITGCGMRGIQDVAELPNVWVDTSGGQPVTGITEYAVKTLGASRVLFGSDVPYRDFSSQWGRVVGANIKEMEKKWILGMNAMELLGMK